MQLNLASFGRTFQSPCHLWLITRVLTALFAKLDPHLGILFGEIAWGWSISDPVLRDVLAADKAIYPMTPHFSHLSFDVQKYTYLVISHKYLSIQERDRNGQRVRWQR